MRFFQVHFIKLIVQLLLFNFQMPKHKKSDNLWTKFQLLPDF